MGGGIMIRYGSGECSLIYKQEVAALEFRFAGKIEISPNLPNGWLIKANNNKMIIIALQKDVSLDELLFSYIGKLKIESVYLYNWELEKRRLPIALQGVDYPEEISSYVETMDIRIEKLSGTLDYNPEKKIIKKTKIIGRVK